MPEPQPRDNPEKEYIAPWDNVWVEEPDEPPVEPLDDPQPEGFRDGFLDGLDFFPDSSFDLGI
jgi:hypothetical protein